MVSVCNKLKIKAPSRVSRNIKGRHHFTNSKYILKLGYALYFDHHAIDKADLFFGGVRSLSYSPKIFSDTSFASNLCND